MNNFDRNLIIERAINTRTELWEDHIYHLSFNPYRFPTYDKKGKFMPLPQRFQEIIAEFKKEFNQQKSAESKPIEALNKILKIRKKISEELLNNILNREKREASKLGEIISNLIILIDNPQTSLKQAYREIEKFIQQYQQETMIGTEPDQQDPKPILNSTIRAGKDWKEISLYFTSELIEEWIKRGFSFNQVSEWFSITSPSQHPKLINDYDFIEWLVKAKKGDYANPEWWLDYSPTAAWDKLLKEFQTTKLSKSFPEIREIEKLLKEWSVNQPIATTRMNACFIKEDTSEYLKFVYQPPQGIFTNLDKFLWFRNNIFYETINGGWQRINHQNVEIKATKSKFIHSYLDAYGWALNGGNGILTYHPKSRNKDEVCRCPEIIKSTEYAEFRSDWQPKYALFKLENFQGVAKAELQNSQGKFPVFHNLSLKKIDLDDFLSKKIHSTQLFLLPAWYGGEILSRNSQKINWINHTQTNLKEWLIKAKMIGEYEHLKEHVNVSYYWNNAKLHESTLDELDLDNFFVDTRANPAGIMYVFKSKKVLFSKSEDLTFELDADKIKATGIGLLTDAGAGLLSLITKGIVNPNLKEIKEIGKTTRDTIHSGKADKARNERQGERKKTLSAGSSIIARSVLGSVPSLLDASHTHGEYSLPEIALRMDSIQLFIRLEFNKNITDHYQMSKQLKKPCHIVFNQARIGDILTPGFIQMQDTIFEGDPDEYYSQLLKEGIYFYQTSPKDFFDKEIVSGEYERGIINRDPVGASTTIQDNYTSAIGHDEQVHIDDMSWVWKDSYCRTPTGADIFPQLINAMKDNIKAENNLAWKFDGYLKGESSAILEKDLEYEWYMHAFSSGQKDQRKFKGLNDGVKVILRQDGFEWELAFIGRIEITNVIGDPSAIGGGMEVDETIEIVEDINNPNNTKNADNFNKTMESQPEESNERVIEEELNPEETRTRKKEPVIEEVEEIEGLPQRDRTKNKERTKVKEEQDEIRDSREENQNK